MPFSLTDLLALEPAQRTEDLHHRAMDDFVRRIGGTTFQDRFELPDKLRNADYLIPSAGGTLIVELKQLTKASSGGSLGDFLNEYVASGRAKPAADKPGTMRFDDTSMSAAQWLSFNKSFRKNVHGAIKSGYAQLKQTQAHLEQLGEQVTGRALWLHNANDLHMPLDLLTRQAVTYVKKEWKAGYFKSLDFVFCTCWDLWQNPWIKITTVASPKSEILDRPPFDFHTVFPGGENETDTTPADAIKSAWFAYVSAAFGAKQLDQLGVPAPTGQLTRFAFPNRIPKLGWSTLARTALVPVAAIPPAPDPAR